MNYTHIAENWTRFGKAIEKTGGYVDDYFIGRPAVEEEVWAVERKLGFLLPPSLKDVLLNFSAHVRFSWYFPENYTLEEPLHEIFSGGISWSLAELAELNEGKEGWVQEVFPNPDDGYDIHWHNSLAFHGVVNGDFLVIDMSRPNKEAVVYLSHDDGRGHGFQLAPTFKDFLFLSSSLGNPGAEDWQWLPFTEKQKFYLQPNCKNAERFRAALQVEIL